MLPSRVGSTLWAQMLRCRAVLLRGRPPPLPALPLRRGFPSVLPRAEIPGPPLRQAVALS